MTLDYFFVLIFFLSLIFLILRLWTRNSKKYTRSKDKDPASVLMVAGSGGHTREILSLATTLGKHYSPRYYIVAETDSVSEAKIHYCEKQRGGDDVPQEYQIFTIPRSREVKQSYLTSILTTCRASLSSFPLVFKLQPDVILCNGPGTCIPICFAGLLLKWFSVKDTYIVYVESFCRVTSMSLSGKLLYRFVDAFFVQWPELAEKYPGAKYMGPVVS
ncbi:UDP-N-acetylglucosamine transferase subunit ALG14 homolog [Aplysia californica]|uniref:UDP-N-acetylglucosamine transferase subunit ALG14 n=1 Tax=Aplysia californica TaxID=6500 RepID=A0ABM0JKM5_APLCA|nr:UDP-N-acetylglucosamine transferase subunit ALG14 homolog [Aplysia californica]